MTTVQRPTASVPLARQAREQFVSAVESVLGPLSEAIRNRMIELVDAATSTRDMQDRRDAMLEYERLRGEWQSGVAKAWRKAVIPPTATARVRLEASSFELIGDDVVEKKILSSRMALLVLEKATWELNDLKARMEHLEGSQELASEDVLRPEAVSQLMVEQWVASGLPRESWVLVQDVIHQQMAENMVEAYRRTNEFLVAQGVLPEIDLSSRVKRGASPARPNAPKPPAGQSSRAPLGEASGSSAGASAGAGPETRGPAAGGVGDETRLMTSSTPLARARMRASGVIGQLKRLLTEKAGFDPDHGANPSPALAEAITHHSTHVQTQMHTQAQAATAAMGDAIIFDDAAVERVAIDLRQRTGELKKKAATSTEKATIEIVALMFQSILAEERIPAAVRVWFARLQMPVLRVAIAEPEFFGSLQHPARQLIDRMGSCVMGFNAAAIGGSALEAEIKRVVQMIEQYPETGRRVFQLVYDEFQKFLSKYLTEAELTRVAEGAQ